MDGLDGTWSVERTSGLLPPMLGVRKRVAGTRGSTIVVDDRIAVQFDVIGNELHYLAPLGGFVDVLTPAGDGFAGRFTWRGRVLGRFTLTRIRGGSMSSNDEQLIKHIDEAHAMEQNVLRLLDGMISTTDDPDILRELEHHRVETEGHAQRMRELLRAHGAAPSTVKQAAGIFAALAKLPLDILQNASSRGEKAGRNARDGFATEHLEIASYELLKRVAQRAGDTETVVACEQIIAEERAMADRIAASWDRVAELSLSENTASVA